MYYVPTEWLVNNKVLTTRNPNKSSCTQSQIQAVASMVTSTVANSKHHISKELVYLRDGASRLANSAIHSYSSSKNWIWSWSRIHSAVNERWLISKLQDPFRLTHNDYKNTTNGFSETYPLAVIQELIRQFVMTKSHIKLMQRHSKTTFYILQNKECKKYVRSLKAVK